MRAQRGEGRIEIAPLAAGAARPSHSVKPLASTLGRAGLRVTIAVNQRHDAAIVSDGNHIQIIDL